jgi:hypothetical protein
MLEDGVRLERLGFEAVWVPDHFYFERDGQVETYPEVWTLLTALARKTEHVRLGTNVCRSGSRPVVRRCSSIVEEAAQDAIHAMAIGDPRCSSPRCAQLHVNG